MIYLGLRGFEKFDIDSGMPRKPRIEYAGAIYHVMCRGNRREAIFRSGRDSEMFLDTLGETVGRCGWRVHAYVLMGNHYHMLIETPEPNLVAGMRWLQGTYTQRFNVRNKECGHLFQGRYKALPVGREGDYFSAVAAYIHLNPARAQGYDFEKQRLEQHIWSSYPGYVWKRRRAEWLCVDEVLGRAGLSDTRSGRGNYRREMELRMCELAESDEPRSANEHWRGIRRGWYFGDEDFRDRMLGLLHGVLAGRSRESFSGEEVASHDEATAERLLLAGLEALGIVEEDLAEMKMSSPEKYALAWLIRRNTSVRNRWIKDRLHMGTATNFADFIRRIETSKHGKWGCNEFRKVKNIEL